MQEEILKTPSFLGFGSRLADLSAPRKLGGNDHGNSPYSSHELTNSLSLSFPIFLELGPPIVTSRNPNPIP